MSSYRNGHPTIGVLAGWQYYWTATPLSYLSPIYRGIRQAAADLGCNLLLSCGMGTSATSDDPLRPAWSFRSSDSDFVPIGPWNTDGLIAVNPLYGEERSRYLQDLIAVGHPVVFVASGESGPTIMADNIGGIREAMQHLVGHGHRRIAFIAGSPEDMAGDTGARLQAYQATLQEFGLPFDEQIVAFGRHTSTGGRVAMKEIIATGAAFTAVLASNDESAIGAMEALREAGLQMPQDVAIIGFDDRPESAVHEPALTSVAVPLFVMGYRAVEQLLRQIQGEPPLVDPVKVATHLVPRTSCGCGDGGMIPMYDTGANEAEGVRAVRRHLSEVFIAGVEQGDLDALGDAVDKVLRQAAQGWDDAAIWQAVVATLNDELPTLTGRWLDGARRGVADALLEKARSAIAASTWQRHQRYVVDQHWTADRLGVLTAHLQMALDETQVYEVLARYLPEMGIQFAAIALLESDNDDPETRCQLRVITPASQESLQFRTDDFPPEGLLPGKHPFSLALLPLVNPRGQLGFVVFDAHQLDLYGAIVQQLAAALNTAELYREATEGRRLAEEANQMKSRFLSTVSHELRAPLNLIVGLSSLLLQPGNEGAEPLPKTLQQDLARINTSAQLLNGLIGDVLDLASRDAGQLRLTRELIDLAQALRLVAETGQQLAADKRLTWRADLPQSGPWVWGDRTRLRQVVLNLISNAVKFTERGSVTLSLEAAPGSVTVIVRDTGMGIPIAEQHAIFDEFRRSERSITRGYRGLGLGLAICKRLIALHEGTIGVHSTGEDGAGAIFFFTLPTVPATEAPQLRLAASDAGAPSVLVLIPPAANGERLRQHLTQRGFRLRMNHMDETQDWLADLVVMPPSAVVLDVSLAPDLGWQALKAIKGNAATRDIPVLFYAAAAKGGAVLELDYLTKPIEVTELTRALDQHWLAASVEHLSHTFLVVDDDPYTLDMHARIVQAHSPSTRVLKAFNGREALDILRRTPVELVLLDLMMPEMDGFAVLEAMRESESTRDIPVIVITGQALTEVEMARLNQGVAAVLGKGVFDVDETLARLDAALERQHRLSSEAQRLVRKAMAYINAHYADSLSRQNLARHVGMSADYLTHCFRQELGMTPIAYLNRYRITQAKRLLKETDQSITEIALNSGFSDSGYFSRIFRREVGMSPEAFRRA